MNELNLLLKQISLGEDSILELKDIKYSDNSVIGPHRDSFASELSAMANSHGGTIILGADDKTHEIIGLPCDKLDITETWIRNIANDLIKPPLICKIRKLIVLKENNEKIIIRIDIPQSIFVHECSDGYFYRIGSSKRKMSPDFLARLFQQRTQNRLIRFDEQLVMDASVNDLKENLFNRFKTDLSPKDNIEFLRKMKLISSNEDNDLYPTVSGILIAFDTPENFISNSYIQAVCYLGDNYGSEQLDAMDITGPLDIQIREACKFVKRNMKTRAVKNPGRIETPQYSLNAVFEAIVNAVAHRDYSIYGSKIRLHIFSDRIELYSPGCIPNSMTIDSLQFRQSSRNELLSSLLSRCPINFENYESKRNFIMDKRGEGVPIILSESFKLSGKMPEYKLIDDTELLLTIFSAF
ncbi:MAG: putative DNA binding domain-containing protein [Treponema sp.]|nr:putative DNA binding domain-containing protein [Treponema sp.]MCL2250371.1 putative DNA binding domain-containing protein [Treponema sp.]